MIGARPEHHVYPVFESPRKSALGERLYARDTNRIFDSRNLSHPQSLDNDGIERLVDEMERSNSTSFLRCQSNGIFSRVLPCSPRT